MRRGFEANRKESSVNLTGRRATLAERINTQKPGRRAADRARSSRRAREPKSPDSPIFYRLERFAFSVAIGSKLLSRRRKSEVRCARYPP